jgi:hypothetical protein
MNYLESVIKNSGLCSGVLTKSDRIPPTEEENWLPFIRGERKDTTSWFCVKCPNTQAINSGVTWERAREDESAFFSQTAPWSTLNSESKQRLGTGNLTRHLSEKLCDLIAERSVFSRLPPKETPVPNCHAVQAACHPTRARQAHRKD